MTDVTMNAMLEAFDSSIKNLRQNFSSQGISDLAKETRLVVFDDQIVIENDLVIGRSAEVGGSLTVNGDFVVKGNMNTDHVGWQRICDTAAAKTLSLITGDVEERIADRVFARAKDTGIDFSSVTVGGQALIEQGTLSADVKYSNLQRVGKLLELEVHGSADINDTLRVKEHRVGINTSTPEMALAIWDNDVCVLAGRQEHNRAFIGTGRRQALDIGVNREGNISIDADGVVTVEKLKVGRHKIGFTDRAPGWEGARGDIYFNSDPSTDVLGWRCLGAFKWQAMRILI